MSDAVPKPDSSSPIDTGCCPPFDPSTLDEKEVSFEDKLFLKDRVRSFLHIPLNFGKIMSRSMAKIEAAGAQDEDMLLLVDENSLWGADAHVSVSKDVPGANCVRMSGRYLTKVFDGPFKNIKKWVSQMQSHVASKGEKCEKLLFNYRTCPRCAKVYGHNWVVLYAQV